MQIQFLRYIKILSISLCIGLVIVGFLNWEIDPYDDLGRNWIGVYTDDSREQAKSVVSFPHDAILIGSSRTMHINPDDLCTYKFYNASFGGALPEEIYYYLEKFAKNEKLVVIGLDFNTFNETSHPILPLEEWPNHYWSTYEYLLGWNVLIDSIKAIYDREFLHYNTHTNGYVPLRNDETPDMESYRWYLDYFMNHDYRNYRISEVRLQFMRKLKKVLDDRHIKYIVFVNPMQEDHWRVVHLSGNDETYLQWINRLQEIFPDVYYFPEGQYSQRELYKNDDPSHYLPITGEMFLNEILGCRS